MDDRPYLTPEELDFRRDASVTALGDGRYVIATDGDDGGDGESAAARPRRPMRARETDESAPNDGESSATTPDYFVTLSARTDEGTFDTRVEGDDIGVVCASMLRWYARRVSPEDDPDEVLSILLSGSEFGFRDPVADR